MGKILHLPTAEMADLYSIGLQINVPKGAAFIDHGEIFEQVHRELWGSCFGGYEDEKITVEIAVNGLLPKDVKSFARGHEEGHALFYLGHLRKLKEIATELNVNLEFMTDKYCLEHDQATERFLKPGYGSSKDFAVARNKPIYEREMVAHIGGLAALVRSHAKPRVIEHVHESIQVGHLDVYPVAEIIDISKFY